MSTKVIFIFLFTLIAAQQITNNPINKIENTQDNVKNSYHFFKDGDKHVLVVVLRTPKPSSSMSLDLNLVNPNGKTISVPEYNRNDKEGGMTVITADFTKEDLYEKYGCITGVDDYTPKCKVLIQHIDGTSRNLEEIDTLIIDENFNPILKLYSDEECTKEIGDNDVIEYGSDVCLSMVAQSGIYENYYFKTIGLSVEFKSADGEAYVSSLLEKNNTYPDGIFRGGAKTIINLFVVGDVNIVQTVKFMTNLNGRLLQSDLGTKKGEAHYAVFKMSDFSEWKSVSLIALLCILLALL